MALIGVGVVSMLILATISLVYCFCDTLTACGRSFHCLAGFWQAIAGIIMKGDVCRSGWYVPVYEASLITMKEREEWVFYHNRRGYVLLSAPA